MTNEELLLAVSSKLDDIKQYSVETRLELKDEINQVKVQVQSNKANWETHLKRTNLLEDKLELDSKQIRKDIEPIQRHITGVKWVIGAILTLGALASALSAIFG